MLVLSYRVWLAGIAGAALGVDVMRLRFYTQSSIQELGFTVKGARRWLEVSCTYNTICRDLHIRRLRHSVVMNTSNCAAWAQLDHRIACLFSFPLPLARIDVRVRDGMELIMDAWSWVLRSRAAYDHNVDVDVE